MYKEIDGRWGRCKFFRKDEYVGRSLWYYGEYNPDETEMIVSLADKEKTSLDIGANMGVISQALIACGHKVVAFEPQPEVHKLLEFNCLNAMGGGAYQTYNTAVGSVAGTAIMPKVYYSEKGNFGGLGLGEKSIYGSYEVPVVTIDSYGFDNVGFMKIDVEGYELEVLKGAYETITRCNPIMYIEDDRTAKSAALREHIRALGYSIEEHKPTLYREKNHFGLKKNVWDRNFASHNLICRPNVDD